MALVALDLVDLCMYAWIFSSFLVLMTGHADVVIIFVEWAWWSRWSDWSFCNNFNYCNDYDDDHCVKCSLMESMISFWCHWVIILCELVALLLASLKCCSSSWSYLLHLFIVLLHHLLCHVFAVVVLPFVFRCVAEGWWFASMFLNRRTCCALFVLKK